MAEPSWAAVPPTWYMQQPISDPHQYLIDLHPNPLIPSLGPSSQPYILLDQQFRPQAQNNAYPSSTPARIPTSRWKAFLPEHAHHLDNPPSNPDPSGHTFIQPLSFGTRPSVEERRGVRLVVDTARSISAAREVVPPTAGARLAAEYLIFPSTASTYHANEPGSPGVSEREKESDDGEGTVREMSGESEDEQESVSIARHRSSPLSMDRPESRVVDIREAVRGLTEKFLSDLDQLAMTADRDHVGNLAHLAKAVEAALERFECNHTESETPAPGPSPDTEDCQAEENPNPALAEHCQTEENAESTLLPIAKHLHGQWLPIELDRLRQTITDAKRRMSSESEMEVDFHTRTKRDRIARTVGQQAEDDSGGGVDWHWVCEEMTRMGSSRSRHQILCKAVELGLKEPLVRRGKKGKRRRRDSVQSPVVARSLRSSPPIETDTVQ